MLPKTLLFCPGVRVHKGIAIVLSLLWSHWLAVVYCLVLCSGSCEPVHKDKTDIVDFLAHGMNKIMKGCIEKRFKVTSDRQQDSPNKLLSASFNKRRIVLEIKCHFEGHFPIHPFK